MGYAAMAVGDKDLAGGLEALKAQGKAAGVRLLSANLVDHDGKPAFDGTAEVDVGGVKVGLVGLSSATPDVAGQRAYLLSKLTAQDPVPVAQAAAKALAKKVDLVVVLGRITVVEARRIGDAVPEARLVLVGGNGRLTGQGQPFGGSLVYEGGRRGQALLTLSVALTGKGPLADRSRLQNDAKGLAAMESRRKAVEAKIAAASDDTLRQALRSELTRLDVALERRRADAATAWGGTVEGSAQMLEKTIPSADDVAALVAGVASSR